MDRVTLVMFSCGSNLFLGFSTLLICTVTPKLAPVMFAYSFPFMGTESSEYENLLLLKYIVTLLM